MDKGGKQVYSPHDTERLVVVVYRHLQCQKHCKRIAEPIPEPICSGSLGIVLTVDRR